SFFGLEEKLKYLPKKAPCRLPLLSLEERLKYLSIKALCQLPFFGLDEKYIPKEALGRLPFFVLEEKDLHKKLCIFFWFERSMDKKIIMDTSLGGGGGMF